MFVLVKCKSFVRKHYYALLVTLGKSLKKYLLSEIFMLIQTKLACRFQSCSLFFPSTSSFSPQLTRWAKFHWFALVRLTFGFMYRYVATCYSSHNCDRHLFYSSKTWHHIEKLRSILHCAPQNLLQKTVRPNSTKILFPSRIRSFFLMIYYSSELCHLFHCWIWRHHTVIRWQH